jgi:hypothetical protein
MNAYLAKVVAHVNACDVCTRAKQRVNDFCSEGRVLFYDYAKRATPTSVEEITLTDEQYDRLVEETRRAQRSGERN